MIKNYLSYAVAAAFFVASGIGNVAFAQTEAEAPKTSGTNDTLDKAQQLAFTDNKIQVTGSIGHDFKSSALPIRDIDFYSFQGRKGDSVRIDIDRGMKSSATDPLRSLDSMIGIFTSDGTLMRTKNDLARDELPDAESVNRLDPWMNDVFLPSTGRYIVGVTSDATFGSLGMRVFVTGGTTKGPDGTDGFKATAVANGTYTLVIERVPAKTIQISIDIRPNAKSITTHANSSGKIPVALITSEDFNALKADQDSIRFGRVNGTGAKGHCNKHGADLLCHFEKRDAGFDEDDTEGMVSGTIDGTPFEGIG
jgi:hypothetical protein